MRAAMAAISADSSSLTFMARMPFQAVCTAIDAGVSLPERSLLSRVGEGPPQPKQVACAIARIVATRSEERRGTRAPSMYVCGKVLHDRVAS